MAGSDRSIFRESAIERYIKKQEHNILLRMATPPVFAFLWILLILALGLGVLAWYVQVPIVVSGQGVVLLQKADTNSTRQVYSHSLQPAYLLDGAAGGMPGMASKSLVAANKPTPAKPTPTKTRPAPTPTVTIHITPIVVPTFPPTLPPATAQPTTAGATAGTTPTPVPPPDQVPAGQKVVVFLFLSPTQQGGLKAGLPVTINIDYVGVQLTGTIEQVLPGQMSPSDARATYHLDGALSQVVTGPSIVAKVDIMMNSAAVVYIGSTCHADVQIGSQSLLSLLPGIGDFFKK